MRQVVQVLTRPCRSSTTQTHYVSTAVVQTSPIFCPQTTPQESSAAEPESTHPEPDNSSAEQVLNKPSPSKQPANVTPTTLPAQEVTPTKKIPTNDTPNATPTKEIVQHVTPTKTTAVSTDVEPVSVVETQNGTPTEDNKDSPTSTKVQQSTPPKESEDATPTNSVPKDTPTDEPAKAGPADSVDVAKPAEPADDVAKPAEPVRVVLAPKTCNQPEDETVKEEEPKKRGRKTRGNKGKAN